MLMLTSAPVAPLLDRLSAEADGANTIARASISNLSSNETHRIMRSKTDYQSLYAQLKDAPMAVSRDTNAP